jgi:ankyrin repeat protein
MSSKEENWEPNLDRPDHDLRVFYAANNGNLELVERLIEKGADIDSQVRYCSVREGRSALMDSAKRGYEDIVILLLQHRANPNLRDNDEKTALWFAITNKHLKIVRLLVDAGTDLNYQDDLDGRTPLWPAILSRNLEILEILLEAGANPNVEDRYGSTPLSETAYFGYINFIMLLLENGADVNHQDRKRGSTALKNAASRGHFDVVRLLLDHGADVNMQCIYGYTPLIMAASNFEEHFDVVQLLLDHGADVNMQTRSGCTAFIFAVIYGHLNILKILMDHGADINLMDEHGRTALDLAKSDEIRNIILQYKLPPPPKRAFIADEV